MEINQIHPLLNALYTNIAAFGMKLVGCILVAVIGVKLTKWFISKVYSSKVFDHVDSNLRSFVRSALSIALYALLVIVCANILGINTASFITVLASFGVALSLALQGALSNVAGGILILFFHPFHVGDFIESNGVAGTVKGISLLYTILETPDLKQVTVPNGSLTASTITNASVNGTRRVDIPFSVSYSSDTETVKAVMLKVAADHPKVLTDPTPFARMTQQDDSALIFTLRAWCKTADYWDVNFDLIENMKKAFDENGISIPFPQLDVHMDK